MEDNEVNQIVVEAYIKNLGYNYLVASNGNEALQLYKDNNIDIILMDIQMPEVDGYMATKYIRDYEEYHQKQPVKIIVQIAYSMEGNGRKCIEAGMDDYISKPIEPEILKKKSSYHLKHRFATNP